MYKLTEEQKFILSTLQTELARSFGDGLSTIYAARNAALIVVRRHGVPDDFTKEWIQNIMNEVEKRTAKFAEIELEMRD